jgi:hypothetical protein
MMVITDPTRVGEPCIACGHIGKDQIAVTVVCDFCSVNADSKVWSYPTPDFLYTLQMPEFGLHASKGDWAACEECHALIEADDRVGLATRTVLMDIEREPESAELAVKMGGIYLSVQGDFFSHRQGEPIYEDALEHFERKLKEEGG